MTFPGQLFGREKQYVIFTGRDYIYKMEQQTNTSKESFFFERWTIHLVPRCTLAVAFTKGKDLQILYYENKDPIQTDSESGCLKSLRTLHVSSCLGRTSPEFCPVLHLAMNFCLTVTTYC